MGKRKTEDRGEQGEGKQMRAERADDQDQQVLRRFEDLIEKVGPEKFRRLAEHVYQARTTGTHGESSTQDRTRQHAQHARSRATSTRSTNDRARQHASTYSARRF